MRVCLPLLVALGACAIWEDNTLHTELEPLKNSTEPLEFKGNVGLFVVTMGTREAHVQRFERVMDRKIHRVTGVDAKTLHQGDLYKDKEVIMHYCTPTKTIALTMAHRNAIQAFLDSDYSHAVIFEDDVLIDHKWKRPYFISSDSVLEVIAQQSDELGVDWLNLGRCVDKCLADRTVTTFIDHDVYNFEFVDSTNPMCAHSYMMNKASAKKIMKHTWPMWNVWDVMPIMMHVADRGQGNKNFKLLSITPRLFEQDRWKLKDGIHNDDNLECGPWKQSYQYSYESEKMVFDREMKFSNSSELMFKHYAKKCPKAYYEEPKPKLKKKKKKD